LTLIFMPPFHAIFRRFMPMHAIDDTPPLADSRHTMPCLLDARLFSPPC